jgi:hypothetical protein
VERRKVEIEIRFTGGPAAAMSARYGDTFLYTDQGEGDLGQRLASAAYAATTPPRPVIIIGTDCPGLTADILCAALDALAENDIVLGPALDGGYYLIGFRRFYPDLFTGIPWSTAEVLPLTRLAASRAGLTIAMLPPLSDVDVPEDLAILPDAFIAPALRLTSETDDPPPPPDECCRRADEHGPWCSAEHGR